MKIHQQTIQLRQKETTKETPKAELCLVKSSLSSLTELQSFFLDAHESLYFSTLKHEKKQLSFLLGRFVAKKAIACFSSTEDSSTEDLKNIVIKTGIFQQPVVCSSEDSKLQVTLSHSENIGIALAFPETHPLGIDLEHINIQNIEAIKTQMTAEELQLVQTLIDSNINLADLYTHIWTSKEALSKVLKTGLMVSLDVLAINSIQKYKNYYIGEFKNFFQYNVLSFKIANFSCSIVYPKQIDFPLNINIEDIQKSIVNTYVQESLWEGIGD